MTIEIFKSSLKDFESDFKKIELPFFADANGKRIPYSKLEKKQKNEMDNKVKELWDKGFKIKRTKRNIEMLNLFVDGITSEYYCIDDHEGENLYMYYEINGVIKVVDYGVKENITWTVDNTQEKKEFEEFLNEFHSDAIYKVVVGVDGKLIY